MKKLFTLSVFIFSFSFCKAQWVTIPDANFVTWLNAHGYSGCMSGNQLNTSCSAVLNATTMNCAGANIYDLTGIQYFTSLTYLSCNQNHLTDLSTLPNSLTALNCGANNLSSLINLPNSITDLQCYGNQITQLFSLPSSLTFLQCEQNLLTSLPDLPNSLQQLYCGQNHLTSLPYLPNSLFVLYCWNNFLTALPQLPYNLSVLYCGNNSIAGEVHLTYCSELNCQNNQITSLIIDDLDPFMFPQGVVVDCNDNQITQLQIPATGSGGQNFYIEINCSNNPLTCLPAIDSCTTLNFSNTLITCLGNYPHVGTSTPALNSLPSCACNYPSGITTSNITATTAKVLWNAECCSQFQIQYRISGTTTWTTKSVASNFISKTLTTLIAGTTYDLRMRIKCANGTTYSSWSAIQNFTTTCTCSKPTSIIVTNLTQTTAKVNWVGNTCAIKYRLQYRKQGTTAWTTKLITAPTLFYNIIGLTSNTIYEYHLRSDCNSTGSVNSGWTTTSTFTTPLRLEDAIITVTPTMTVTPNPCTTCEITGAANANELTVTDILGRKLNATFNQSANGYYINLPETSTGLFLIRNTKTGEVVKFLKE